MKMIPTEREHQVGRGRKNQEEREGEGKEEEEERPSPFAFLASLPWVVGGERGKGKELEGRGGVCVKGEGAGKKERGAR